MGKPGIGISYCLVPGCKMSTDDCLSFFTMPEKNKNRCESWADILKLPKLDHYTKKVCQLHFDDSQFTSRQRTRLKYNAIPRPFSIEPIAKSTPTTVKGTKMSKSTTCPLQPLPMQPTIKPNVLLKDLRVRIERLQSPAPSREIPQTEEITLENVIPPCTPPQELNICILCQKHSALPIEYWYSNQTIEKLEELQMFLVTILKLDFKCFEDFPFCKLCTARMEELHNTYAVLRILQFKFEKQTEELKKDFIKIFLGSRLNSSNPSPKLFDSKTINAVAEKWKRVQGQKTRNQEQQTENIVSLATNAIQSTIRVPVHLIIQTSKITATTSTVGVNTEPEEDVDSVIDNLSHDESTQDSFQSEVPMEENCITDSTNNTTINDLQPKPTSFSKDDLENFQVEAPIASPSQQIANNMNKISKVTDSTFAAPEDCELTTIEEELDEEALDKQVSLMIENYKEAIQKIPPEPKKIKIKPKRPLKLRTCPVCNVVRKGISAFKCHMLLHTGERPWKCSDCEKDFVQSAHLFKHQKVIHGYQKNNSAAERNNFVASKSRMYCCGVCNSKDGCTKPRFLRHVKNRHINKEIMDGDTIWFYDCDGLDCKKSFSKQEQLKNHIVTEHDKDDSPVNDCDVCLRVFCSPENLLVHKTSHLSVESVYPCSYCYMVFSTEGEFNDHVPRHKIEFQLSQFRHLCELCGEGFLTDMSLWQHKYKTSSCQTMKSRKSKLILPGTQQIRTTAGEKRTCEFCGKTGESCNIRNHRYVHTHPDGFPCTKCSHVAKTPKYLENHQIVVHSLPSGQSLNTTCEICKRMFCGGKQLKVHQIRHHPEEYLQGKIHCLSCFDLFDTEQLMNTHFHEKHPHKICPVDDCGRKFGAVSYLKKHVRTHTGERPYQCSYCDETFTQDATLTAHATRRHTKHRAILCKLCPENPGFFERREFYKHASINHPELDALEIMQTNYLKKKYVPRPPRKSK